jgi:CRISPR type III-A-associated protein Csm2
MTEKGNKKWDAIEKINEELILDKNKTISDFFSREDLYLPKHKAHRIANALRDLNVNQLRKIFDMIDKSSMLSKENKYDQALEHLFMVVPMVAYATGRNLINPTSFNKFIQLTITPERIKSDKDIQALFKLMQSVIAYKKDQ